MSPSLSLSPSETGYSTLQKRLHWAVVGLLFCQYFVFDGMGRPFHGLMDSGVATYDVTSVLHIGIGILILGAVMVRLALRLRLGTPGPVAGEPEIFQTAARYAHIAMYALLLLLPVTGLVAWFLQVGAAAELHEILKTLLMILVIMHVAAVALHQLVWKTGVLHRMI
ncbi:cytochrome b [Pseudooceanicola sp. C21-150M6]|uniref:cytochrome b n=1 Tax=Pseudooceanicola sp. C21-150M6 TaxID=3434355 RepID=UPI003D7FB478